MFKSHTAIWISYNICHIFAFIIVNCNCAVIISNVPRTVFLEILHRYEYHMSSNLIIYIIQVDSPLACSSLFILQYCVYFWNILKDHIIFKCLRFEIFCMQISVFKMRMGYYKPVNKKSFNHSMNPIIISYTSQHKLPDNLVHNLEIGPGISSIFINNKL